MSTLFFDLLKNKIVGEFAFEITSYFKMKGLHVYFFIKSKLIRDTRLKPENLFLIKNNVH